jgi:NAD(P)-dependent dehydrogenase (short-subunit alcohol dehydrogenase family)
MDQQIKGKKILLIGCTGVLGSNFTEYLYQNYGNLILADLKTKRFDQFRKKYPKAFFVDCDITKEKNLINLHKKIKKKFKYLDAIIFNVGLTSKTSQEKKMSFPNFENYSLKSWNNSINTNLTGAFLAAKNTISFMKKRGGSLIFISSIYGIIGPDSRIYSSQKFRTLSGYSASKAGLIGLSKWLATNYAQNRIRVNTIIPGGIKDKQNKLFIKKYSERVPMKRMGNSFEVNGILAYLIGEKSSYVTGQEFIIDGGLTSW